MRLNTGLRSVMPFFDACDVSRLTRRATGVLLLLVGIAACTGAAHVGQYPNQQRMIGKSKDALLACAGTPRKEQPWDGATLLRYYREAPILEESEPVGRGSFAAIRHGCWATAVIEDARVTDVVYQFVPAGIDASNDCEAIFDSCIP
jgi:hypothetical protein